MPDVIDRKITAERSVTNTRVIDAPREKVFNAWIDPKLLAQWWGPRDFDNPRCEIDAVPGGRIHVDMRGPDGTIYPMSGTMQEVKAPERLVFAAIAEDHDGSPHLESRTEVTFEDLGDTTKVTVVAKAKGFTAAAPQMLGGMDAGWTQSLEKLDMLTTSQPSNGATA
jgi:uncharacterized protein YndB with AHSA1/START domain